MLLASSPAEPRTELASSKPEASPENQSKPTSKVRNAMILVRVNPTAPEIPQRGSARGLPLA